MVLVWWKNPCVRRHVLDNPSLSRQRWHVLGYCLIQTRKGRLCFLRATKSFRKLRLRSYVFYILCVRHIMIGKPLPSELGVLACARTYSSHARTTATATGRRQQEEEPRTTHQAERSKKEKNYCCSLNIFCDNLLPHSISQL